MPLETGRALGPYEIRDQIGAGGMGEVYRRDCDGASPQIIVSAIVRRHSEIDFRTATAARLAWLNDAEVLALAARDRDTGDALILI
jgi:hypothetical protein